MPVTLPPHREEFAYSLKAHRDLPVAERPIFWYRKPDFDEVAEYADNATVNIIHRATQEVEERRFHAQLLGRILLKHLTRFERLFEDDGVTAIVLPPLEPSGKVPTARKQALNRLPRDWQLELAEAITEGREDEDLRKN